MTLRRLGGKAPEGSPGGAVLASVVRNEALRLPAWLAHYRRLGLERFIFVDNGSTDGTRELLLAEPGALVLGTSDSFRESRFGMAWLNPLLGRWCEGRWVLLADADELLVWPGGDDIRALTGRLEQAGAQALFAAMIDMYSDRPFGSIGYRAGEPLEQACPFFDRGPYRLIPSKRFPFRQAYGGLRARLFRRLKAGIRPPTASKVPLVRWHAGQGFAHVAHALAQPVALAQMRAALLHFKLLDDIVEKCRVEVERKEHYADGREYLVLAKAIAAAPGGSFVDPKRSLRYEGPGQLLAKNLMNADSAFS